MSEFMKKTYFKEAYGKDIKGKMFCTGITFLTKCDGFKRVLSLPMRHSNIDVPYVPTGLIKNRMLNSYQF